MAVSVKELIANPFHKRTLEQKMQIIQSDKPRPVINDEVTINKRTKTVSDLYNEKIWLTACEENQTLYCWTCLLFPIYDCAEITSIVARTPELSLYKLILQHEASASHITGFFRYRIFLKEILQSKANPGVKELISSDRRNREVLKRIIDAVCLSINQVPPPPSAKTNGDCYPFNFEKRIELLLNSLKKYEKTNITEEATDIARRYPKILTDTMEAMVGVMQRAIIQETQLCSHVSLILSGHPKDKETSTVSSVFRYITKGNVYERFINFKNFTDLKNADDVEIYILGLIQDYEISSKIFSLSIDGAVLPRQFLSKLTVLFHEPTYRFFSPSHFHGFNYILEQSVSNFEECDFFFNVLNSMRTFFRDSPQNCEAFDAFNEGEVIALKNLKLDNSQFLIILRKHIQTFIAFFSEMAENNERGDENDISKANGYLNILQDFRIVFLIETFYLLFQTVAILSEMLGSCSPENAFDPDILDRVKKRLMTVKLEGFKKLFTHVAVMFATEGEQETTKAVTQEEKSELHALFLKIVDCIIEEVNVRFECASKLEFLSFLNCEPHSKLVVSDHQVAKIQDLPLKSLKRCQTVKELKVLSKNGAVFGGKSVFGLMDILTKSNLSDTFKNVYRLAEIIVTLPCKPIPHTNNPSKFETISAWASVYGPENQFLTALCVEKDYLEYLSSRYNFHDDVILKLQELNSEVKGMFN